MGSAVFDTLTSQKKLKPIIGIFVSPGNPIQQDQLDKKKRGPGSYAFSVPQEEREAFMEGKDIVDLQRSFEYDSVSDRLLEMYLKEIIPLVENEIKLDIFLKTKDGKMGGLNKELFPRGAFVCGWDSGGLASFWLAYQRPDFFQRVMSNCGNFTGWRGAHNVPYLVRTTRRKEVKTGHPIRVFMTSAIHDLVSPHG